MQLLHKALGFRATHKEMAELWKTYYRIFLLLLKSPLAAQAKQKRGGEGVKKRQTTKDKQQKREGSKKYFFFLNAISPCGNTRGKQIIGATICISQKIRCLLYACFFTQQPATENIIILPIYS